MVHWSWLLVAFAGGIGATFGAMALAIKGYERGIKDGRAGK